MAYKIKQVEILVADTRNNDGVAVDDYPGERYDRTAS